MRVATLVPDRCPSGLPDGCGLGGARGCVAQARPGAPCGAAARGESLDPGLARAAGRVAGPSWINYIPIALTV
jgi:hypothetical protein